jgi:spoIIIJ-associated protein
MSSNLDFEGKTLENAIDNACKELRIEKDQLIYKVLSQGSSGIFGLVGAKNAKIQVTCAKKTSNYSTTMNDFRRDLPSVADASLDRPGPKPKHFQAAETGYDDTDSYPSDPVELARISLKKILDFITEGTTITIDTHSDIIRLKVAGGSSAVLIGKHGQTLEAIQYIVEKIVNKRNKKRIRLKIDIEDYLKNRKNNLQKLATRLAHKAKKSGKPVSIGMMNAHDRRIVHVTLKNDLDVKTKSLGDGFIRKLMIFPNKKASSTRSATLSKSR